MLWYRAPYFLIIVCLALASHDVSATTTGNSPTRKQGQSSVLGQAQAEFAKQNYDEAVNLYRKHLRAYKTDYNAWNQLAASYYHTGLPRRALRYLKQVEKKTTDRSYNFYYQGLCYQALETFDQARAYLQSASQVTDEYGSRAIFELASIEYNERNREKSAYWLNIYLSRFPNGVYKMQSTQMLQSLASGMWIPNVRGVEKPDMEKALYRYNKLSLINYPHYWLIEAGTTYNISDGWEPKGGGGLSPRATEQLGIIANAGVGVGPWREGPMTAWGGYSYRQQWFTDRERLDTWTDEITDFKYFPFRADLLERRHQFYGDFRRQILDQYFVGVFSRMEFARIGSNYFPTPDDNELKTVLRISDTTLFIPWVGATYYRDFRTLFYLFFRKEINSDSPELSNKTFIFDGKEPAFSMGISHDMPFPEYDLNVDVELFQYEFVYNDYWLDYTRRGLITSGEFQFLPRWFGTLFLGYYSDVYQIPRKKLINCSSNKATEDQKNEPTASEPINCPRTDTGLLYQGGVYWNYTQFTRISANYLVVENSNSTQKEFSEKRQRLEASVTWAFPSVKRVDRFVNRFADSAFTKEVD